MENASKALIIAGAILLSILIIAIGMYIYNSSTNSIYSAADQISTQERDSFNSQWTSYEESQPGSSIRSMISKLISNANVNAEEKTKLPDLYYEPNLASCTAGDTDLMVISTTGSLAIDGFNAARTQIETKHTYYVELHYSDDTSLVDAIYVHYLKPGDDSEGTTYTLPTLTESSYVDNDDETKTSSSATESGSSDSEI